jgi:hypothetical protein
MVKRVTPAISGDACRQALTISGVRMSRSSDVVSCTRMRAVALPLRLDAP